MGHCPQKVVLNQVFLVTVFYNIYFILFFPNTNVGNNSSKLAVSVGFSSVMKPLCYRCTLMLLE